MAKQSTWNQEEVSQRSDLLKQQLKGLPDDSARLQYCVDQIDNARSAVDQFVACVHSLILAEKTQELGEAQWNRIFKFAEGILLTNGIYPVTSRLCHLHGYLHLAMAKLHRRLGDSWKAAWSQQYAYQQSQRSPVGEEGHFAYYMVISSACFGYEDLQAAWATFTQTHPLPEKERTRVLLEEVRGLRFQGHLEESKTKADALAKATNDAQVLRELDWETLLRQIQTDQKPKPLLLAVRHKATHHHPDYIFEAFLWSRAVRDTEMLQQFPTLSSLASASKLFSGKRYKRHRTVLQLLERLYDTEYPLFNRLRFCEELFSERDRFLSIDLRLLLRACVLRWLARHSSYAMAALVLREYEATCFGITRGKSRDPLQLIQDLDSASWVRSHTGNRPRKAA